MSEYVKSCNYCKQQIRMSQRLGKWYPSDLDGGIHRCEAKAEAKKQEAQKQQHQEPQQLKTLLEATALIQQLDARVKRLEGIVIDPRKSGKNQPDRLM